MKPTDPLTRDEVATASETFFDLFAEVLDRAPEGTSIDDALKMSETIFKLAHSLRKTAKEKNDAFGFHKDPEMLAKLEKIDRLNR